MIVGLGADSLGVAVDAASSAGVREIRTGALPRGVAEAVTFIAPCRFRSARSNAALRPADADGRQALTGGDRNSGGGH